MWPGCAGRARSLGSPFQPQLGQDPPHLPLRRAFGPGLRVRTQGGHVPRAPQTCQCVAPVCGATTHSRINGTADEMVRSLLWATHKESEDRLSYHTRSRGPRHVLPHFRWPVVAPGAPEVGVLKGVQRGHAPSTDGGMAIRCVLPAGFAQYAASVSNANRGAAAVMGALPEGGR